MKAHPPHAATAPRRGGPLRDPPELMALARRQHGVVTAAQLRQHGISRFTQRGRMARGLWVCHFGAVVVHPAADGTPLQDAWAIALQLPVGGAVSGVTALHLWRDRASRLGDLPRLAVVPRDILARINAVRVLRLTPVRPESVSRRWGVPVRTLGESLMDLFTVLPRKQAQELLDHALQLRWIAADQLADLARVRGGRGRRGAVTIRQLMGSAAGGCHSEAERRTAKLLKSAGITGWIANYQHRTPSGRIIAELDFAWPKERVWLEIDGWEFHSGRRAFESDRAREAALRADGWTPLRATWKHITRQQESLIASIRGTLAHCSKGNGQTPGPAVVGVW